MGQCQKLVATEKFRLLDEHIILNKIAYDWVINVYVKFCSCFQRMGRQADSAAGRPGRVAESPGHMAVPGAHLQLPRYHGADARGRSPIHHRRQELA